MSALTPDVRLDGELVVGQGLGGGPLDGELGPLPSVVDVALHEAAEAEIGHFHSKVVINKAVSGSKVSRGGRRGAERDRQTNRQTERDSKRQTERETERQRETERGIEVSNVKRK